jgi:hypothetical protein
MEFLIELLIEVFGEIILTIFAEGIASLVHVIDGDPKLKRNLKLIFTYSILLLTIFLIVMSLMYSKTFLTIIAISYMLLTLIVVLIKRINKDKIKSKLVDIFISIFKRLIRYGYPIVLIVFSSLYITNAKALVSIIIISVVAIILWFSIDMYKVWSRNNFRESYQYLKEDKENDEYYL